ncbi:MAG TPA: DUF4157 domain-containing protein [Lunatimonas sp.]|nr:DUF4157 domain-containing protein [Lunatimonas sp.]
MKVSEIKTAAAFHTIQAKGEKQQLFFQAEKADSTFKRGSPPFFSARRGNAVQPKSDIPNIQASSDLESRLNSSRGGGSPLPEKTRTSMESAFGSDFSGVRVHTNSGAVRMNQELGAQAFTHGSNIYFNSGKYNPGRMEGQRLLGHELTHVVQQGHAINLKKDADEIRGKTLQSKEVTPTSTKIPANVQKKGHEQDCGCSTCTGKTSLLKSKEPDRPFMLQRKGHDRGCGCPECAGQVSRQKIGPNFTQFLQRKQTNELFIQLAPSNVVPHTFLGVGVSGGVDRRMVTRLNLVQGELQRQYNALPVQGRPASLQEYAGLSTISGWQDRSGSHGTGNAVDVNYYNQPYIATRTTEGGRTTYGGERAERKLPDTATDAEIRAERTRVRTITGFRQPAVEVYDRAMNFVRIQPTALSMADVGNRRTGETATEAYRRFHTVSEALRVYFGLVFHTNYERVTRRPIVNPETASETVLLSIPTTERKDEASAVADITTFMADPGWIREHPSYPLSAREQFFRILRDYEVVRKPMLRGSPSTQPSDTRNPALGFLHMPEHFVVAMMDQGNLRWGACEFSRRANGDIHHFDMTAPYRTPAPVPAAGTDAVPDRESVGN